MQGRMDDRDFVQQHERALEELGATNVENNILIRKRNEGEMSLRGEIESLMEDLDYEKKFVDHYEGVAVEAGNMTNAHLYAGKKEVINYVQKRLFDILARGE